MRQDRGLRRRLAVIYALLLAGNAGAWAWAVLLLRHQPTLLGSAVVAYAIGLRHAVDADHIAAIDNVTRAQLQQQRRPASIGFFFSLGHSSVVVLASLAIVLAAHSFKARLGVLQSAGGLIGTGVSAGFLLLVASINTVVLAGLLRRARGGRGGAGGGDGGAQDADAQDADGQEAGAALDRLLGQRGLLSRVLRPCFALVRHSWHMYPLGLLFGLGFDTATEISLLGMAAAGAGQGLPTWSIMVFPALFTAGMSLVDTFDSTLMLGAYGWAFRRPQRKLWYNISVTALSVGVALVVGGIETAGLLQDRLDLQGWLALRLRDLSDHLGALGALVIGLFMACWLVSALVQGVRAR